MDPYHIRREWNAKDTPPGILTLTKLPIPVRGAASLARHFQPNLARPLEEITPPSRIDFLAQPLRLPPIVTRSHRPAEGAIHRSSESIIVRGIARSHLAQMKKFFPLFGPGLFTVSSFVRSPWTIHFGGWMGARRAVHAFLLLPSLLVRGGEGPGSDSCDSESASL